MNDPAPLKWVAFLVRTSGLVFLRPAEADDPHVFAGYWSRHGTRLAINFRWVIKAMNAHIPAKTCLQVPVDIGLAREQGACLSLNFCAATLRRVQQPRQGV